MRYYFHLQCDIRNLTYATLGYTDEFNINEDVVYKIIFYHDSGEHVDYDILTHNTM
jgi:hypothetical protein